MITLYSGTPGSGKSLHLAREVSKHLKVYKRAVIANFPINMELVAKDGKRKVGDFIYLPNHEITVDYLRKYAKEHHRIGREGQTLIVIDEAGIMFNTRDYGNFDRKGWIQFFMTHRHYGFNVILVAQNDRLIDRQIRAFIEFDVKHRKANNYKTIGLILSLLRIPVFVAITYWYGMRERCYSEFFRYRKRDSRLYDTMMLFSDDDFGNSIGMVANEEEQNISDDQQDESHPVAVATVADGDTALAEGPPSRPGRLRSGRLKRVWEFLNKPILIRRIDDKNEIQDQGL